VSDAPWRYAICNELFAGWPLGRVASFAGSLGYQGLELAPYTLCDDVAHLTAEAVRRIRAEVEAGGLPIVGLHWLLAHTEGLHLNDPDPAVRQRTADYLLREVDLCADLGGSVLVLGSPAQRNPPDGVSAADAWRWTAHTLRRCAERAEAARVVFCLESLPRPESQFITTVDEALAMVREVDRPGLQMMVDVKSMAADPRPIPEQIRAAAPLLRHVHANDPNRLGPGMGSVALEPILATLREVEYRGYISVEAFDTSVEIERIARESIANLRSAAESKGAL